VVQTGGSQAAPAQLTGQLLQAAQARPANGAAGDLRGMHRLAADKYATVDSFVVLMRRREQVNGKKKPEETIALKFRKTPFSVHLKWLAGDAKGREAVYVQGRFGDKIHSLLGPGDMILPFGGKRMSLSPDSPLIRGQCRHPITEAGVGAMIDRFGLLVEAADRGATRAGTLKYLGAVRRPEFDAPVEAAMQTIAPGVESGLPRGGARWWFFDTTIRLPVLIVTHDDRGEEVEYYCYERFRLPLDRFGDDDFNPDLLWGR
jgi:hypothetical protein